jgi:hypothetical protein
VQKAIGKKSEFMRIFLRRIKRFVEKMTGIRENGGKGRGFCENPVVFVDGGNGL